MIPRGVLKAKAIYQVYTDCKVRKLENGTGFDTRILLAVNDADYEIGGKTIGFRC